MLILNPSNRSDKIRSSWLSIEDHCILDIVDCYLAGRELSVGLFPKELDHDELFRVAQRHGVSSIISHILLEANLDLPESLIQQAKRQRMVGKIRTAVMDKEFCYLLGELQKDNIVPLVMKGFAALERYPAGLPRQFGDFDFQMSNDEIEGAHEILIRNGYTTVDVEPDEAIKKLHDEKSSPHMPPYIKNNGFPFVVELHRLDFYAFRGIPSQPMYLNAKPCTYRNGAIALRHTDEDLVIFSFLHFVRHEYALIGRVREGARLIHLLDGCILLKSIVPDIGWQKILDRVEELNATYWIYYAFLRARLLCKELFPKWVMDHLLSKLDCETLYSHPVVWNFVDYQANFLEWLMRPEEEMARLTEKAKELREWGLTGRVLCRRGDNPLEEYKKNKHIHGVLKIDPGNAPEWNFYKTQMTRANRPYEFRILLARFTWDDDYFYSYINVRDNNGSNVSFDYLLDIILLEFFHDTEPLFTFKIILNKDYKPNVIIRDQDKNIELPADPKCTFIRTDCGYVLNLRVPWSLVKEHFDFTPQPNLELGFNVSFSDHSPEGEWTQNRMDWSLSPAYGVIEFK